MLVVAGLNVLVKPFKCECICLVFLSLIFVFCQAVEFWRFMFFDCMSYFMQYDVYEVSYFGLVLTCVLFWQNALRKNNNFTILAVVTRDSARILLCSRYECELVLIFAEHRLRQVL